ncbi:potassium transporter Kup [Propionibacteriaceae bacterium Y1923]|uniref:potassium transporter Kup n=1 Tax=Aestuariimicrobium sp. Y1814 TaxID=3418742 RepID=UPI003C1D343A
MTERVETRRPTLALAALGVVFGDIGTSPLYSLQTVFAVDNHAVPPDRVDVLGIISLVFWSLVIVVSVKYVALVMRADNDGEGGILALVALLRERLRAHPGLAVTSLLLGIVGAALFYGDSVITPAISVMSAVEGLKVLSPATATFVVPASVVVLTALFAVQRFGTELIGRAFGPVMALWFLTLAVLGVPHIVANPAVLQALLPHHALVFLLDRPLVAFIAIGAVVLCITGAEALYADMGHFGRGPIALAWFSLVLPCLLLNYFGQGAMILENPASAASPFFLMAPRWALVPLVVLATAATVIASQSVISGAFSVSRQATRMGLLPRLDVRHTSRHESGQIYIGSINWLLFVGVLTLVALFHSSARLANAYGLAVTGTLVLTTTVFLFLARHVWRWPAWKMLLVTITIGGLEVVYLLANLTKVFHGGWVPLLLAGSLVTIMLTWRHGQGLRAQARTRLEGPLAAFIDKVHQLDVPRVEGVAVFPHHDLTTTPLALKENLRFNHVLHTTNVIVTVVNENVPHIRHVDRASVDNLGSDDDGIFRVVYRVGFNDSQDIPKALRWALEKQPEMTFDPAEARYFLSVLRVRGRPGSPMSHWRRELFRWLVSHEASRSTVFHLPAARTIVMGGEVEL